MADGYAQVLSYELQTLIKKGEVKATQGEIAALNADGTATLNVGTVPCDLVVCATGFQKDYSYLPEDELKALGVEDDGLYLFRNTLPIDVPDLAFCGSEVATISNVTVHGLQAEWICDQVLESGNHNFTKSEMTASVEKHKAWARSWMPMTTSRASLVLLHQIHFYDQLLKASMEHDAHDDRSP